MKIASRTQHKQLGLSIVELLISVAIGLVLMTGVLSIFTGMRTTTEETTSLGALQENGRFALSVLTDDLMRQGYWGSMAQQLSDDNLIANPRGAVALTGDCIGQGLNNESFPRPPAAGEKFSGHFRSLWSLTAADATPINCIANAKKDSDVLQIKRVVAAPVAGNGEANRYYLNTNASLGAIAPGNQAPTTIAGAQLWQYQHHVYYVREDQQGNDVVPVLMQGYLRVNNNSVIDFQPLIDGIEMIRFMYGVDTDNDGAVNLYLPSNLVQSDHWDNANNNRILSVKIYVLARDILRDPNYENKNTYQLGDLALTVDDDYRRMLFSSTVTLYNSGIDSW